MSDHSSHDFLDKYDYSKSNNEIVKNIMKNFILSIQENNKDNKKKLSNILLKKDNPESDYNDTQEKIVNILNEILKVIIMIKQMKLIIIIQIKLMRI